MPKSAQPGAPPAPPRPMGTDGVPARRSPWQRQALLLLLLICVMGIIPMALAGDVFGWWTLSLHAPFVVPR